MGTSLQGKVAIVTGAGRGIGAATARRLADEGMRVVLASRTESELHATADGIGAARALAVPTDLASEASIIALFEETLARFGDLHVLVNNGGTFRAAPVEAMTAADWDAVMAVNFHAVVTMTREAWIPPPAVYASTVRRVNLILTTGERSNTRAPRWTAAAARPMAARYGSNVAPSRARMPTCAGSPTSPAIVRK